MERVPYTPPDWAKDLKLIPKSVYRLGMKPTPIHSWELPDIPSDFQLFIKRDDMTGSILGGSKIRILEFILADAKDRGCKHIVAAGGVHSNHCRITAGAARLLGLKTHALLCSDNYQTPEKDIGEPSLLMHRLFGSDVHLMPYKKPYPTVQQPAMDRLAASVEERIGEKCYVIPEAGISAVGLFGYFELFEEMRKQNVEQDYDDVVVAVGAAGTIAGLAIACYLTKSPLKIHAISGINDKYYVQKLCQELIDEFEIPIKANDILNVIDEYREAGHNTAPPPILNLIEEVSQATGIILDPVYTAKAILGLREELKRRPQQFKGRRILYLHTGGTFTKSTLKAYEKDSDSFSIRTWTDVETSEAI